MLESTLLLQKKNQRVDSDWEKGNKRTEKEPYLVVHIDKLTMFIDKSELPRLIKALRKKE